MAKLTKRQKAVAGKVDSTKLYPLDNALALVKECATAKFDESIDVAVQLGIDAKKSDQVVRGAVVMPNGTGKTKRVAVFAQGAKAEEARAAGADIVGMEDLADQVKAGNMNFDVVIASPDTMRVVGTLGQILGPRGLMPNPKVGTVTPGRRHGGAERQGRPGAVPRRQGRHHPRDDRPRARSSRQAGRQPARADRGAEQGQAGVEQGHLSAQGGAVVDDGRGCPGRRGVDQRSAPRSGLIERPGTAPARVGRRGPSRDGGPSRRATGRLGSSKTAGAAPDREAGSNGQRRWRSRRRGIEFLFGRSLNRGVRGSSRRRRQGT